ncbi:hypothetical protein [Pseudomonas putida]|uniref:Uncharacterized protein n=1 Tax=Pseudomonas putida TaxID=303 RepID=A0A1L7NQ03_PSEPU|nr:hypothetical protein [Pseudomonas putida]BAW27524.1 Uncharacterized protein KF715C_pC910 [Pseudomonas putida]
MSDTPRPVPPEKLAAVAELAAYIDETLTSAAQDALGRADNPLFFELPGTIKCVSFTQTIKRQEQ